MKAEIPTHLDVPPSWERIAELEIALSSPRIEVARLSAELAARSALDLVTVQCACCGVVGQWTNSVEDAIDPGGETPVEAPEVPLCDACAEPPQSGGPTLDEVWRRLAARRESRANPHPAAAEQPEPPKEG